MQHVGFAPPLTRSALPALVCLSLLQLHNTLFYPGYI